MIEVLFAVAVFSMVAVGSLTIMNQGSASAQRSLEIALVRHEMDTQADAIRLIYDEMMAGRTQRTAEQAATWRQMSTVGGTGNLAKATASVFPGGVVNGNRCRTPVDTATMAFIMNTNTMQPVRLTGSNSNEVGNSAVPSAQQRVFAGVTYSPTLRAQGIWVEAERHGEGYVDFHIRACWDTVGQAQPITLGTIVRLYDPEL